MQEFIGKDFLLKNETARTLYHNYAAKMPVVDYHCHINPQEIYENKKFADITEAWLGGDHYKWRLMRANGVDEKYITGNATNWEKFEAFAKTLPRAIGNPVYHWAHLELKRYFGCETPLNADTAKEVWEFCNQKLQSDENLRVRGIIQQSGVTTIVTTDDPIDTLEWHTKIKEDTSFTTKVLPAWRPDKAINIDRAEFSDYMSKLSVASAVVIDTMSALYKALAARMEYFAAVGCKASDHGVDNVVYAPATEAELDAILQKGLCGEPITPHEANQYKYNVLQFLGQEYACRGWVMEIHFGAMRNVNSKGFAALGADTGYDCISPANNMPGLAQLLNDLNELDRLPQTLIFSLNPGDDAAINTLAGCFQQGGVRGRVQQGSAWWFNDNITGMVNQMTSFANLSVLGNFVGMLTDSRSFMSYTRHEYFRRILCNLLGTWVEEGAYPSDMQALGSMVQDICYNNAMAYFGY
ncbi:glucuronate isomerase [Ruminococcaceae bacterium OttesenSCG-928-A16]|nr:glucuronate isomerase [Ruminococcaceae bacterium OttesenSCG-928-A16]